MIGNWDIAYNYLEHEQLKYKIQNFIKNHKDGTIFSQTCLPFLFQIANLPPKGCAHI